MTWTDPGANDNLIYKDGFHDRLSRFWPHPREQLHSGGWQKTDEMVADIKRLMALQPGGISRVLDLCCGEGATAVHLAATEGWEVTGVELVQSATMVGRAKADQYGTVVRVKLETNDPQPAAATNSGEGNGVKYQVSYGTAVGVKLAPAANGGTSPVQCNLSYNTTVGVKLAAKEDSDGSSVRCSLSYETPVGVKLAAKGCNTKDGSVLCKVSYNPVVIGKVQCWSSTDQPAIRLRLSYQSVGDLVRIANASVQYLPLPSNSYDVVYGQDPDGLANENRVYAFKEVMRVLRPGGLFYFWHHWIPGPGWRRDLLNEYWGDPLTGSPRLSHECYLEDLQAAGLHLVSARDTSRLSAKHMGAMADRMRREAPCPDGSIPDKWLERSLQFAATGGTMGIHVVAFKPPAPPTAAAKAAVKMEV